MKKTTCSFIPAGSCITYILIQSAYALLFFTAFLFWSVALPFSYRGARANGQVKRAALVASAICFLFPFISLVLLKDGYFAANFFMNRCTARDSVAFYFVGTLHIGLLVWISSTFFILIVRIIFKVGIYSMYTLCACMHAVTIKGINLRISSECKTHAIPARPELYKYAAVNYIILAFYHSIPC